jgi:hypothetical protein
LASKTNSKQLNQLKGKSVSHASHYLKVTSKSQHNLSREAYERELNQTFHSKLPQRIQFIRISLNLVYEGGQKFVLIGDEQIDYSPANVKPSLIMVQYKQGFRALSQHAKQSWVSVSELNPHSMSLSSRL